MKKLFLFTAMLLVQLLVFAQSEGTMRIEKTDGSVIEYNVAEIKHVSFISPEMFSVTPEVLTFEAEEGSVQVLRITSNVEWKILNLPEWLSATQTEGKKSADVIITTTSKNTSSANRTSTFYFLANNNIVSISATQKYVAEEEKITPMVGAYNVDADANTITLNVSSNTDWTVSANVAWLSLSATSGSKNDAVTVYVAANTLTSSRSGKVTYTTVGGKTATVTINQEAAKPTILFEEPCLEWGSSISKVKTFMKSYTLNNQVVNQGKTYLIFNPKFREEYVGYIFDESGKLALAEIAIDKTKISENELHTFLSGKYQFIGKSEARYAYMTNDGKTALMMGLNSDGTDYLVQYIEFPQKTEVLEEPYVAWGSSFSNVKSTMQSRGYTLLSSSAATSDMYLIYDTKFREYYSRYNFTSTKLERVTLVFLKNEVSLSELRDAMSNSLGYVYLGQGSDGAQYLYTSQDSKTIALVYESKFSDTNEEILIALFVDANLIAGGAKGNKLSGAATFGVEMPEVKSTDVAKKRMSEEIGLIYKNSMR